MTARGLVLVTSLVVEHILLRVDVIIDSKVLSLVLLIDL